MYVHRVTQCIARFCSTTTILLIYSNQISYLKFKKKKKKYQAKQFAETNYGTVKRKPHVVNRLLFMTIMASVDGCDSNNLQYQVVFKLVTSSPLLI